MSREMFTAVTGGAMLSTANPSLDGSGTLATLIDSSGNGTLIKRIVLKAIEAASGVDIVRFFVSDGTSNLLIQELYIEPIFISAVTSSYGVEIVFDFFLMESYQLKATTDQGYTYELSVEGLEVSYP